jgi:carbonic anhydrase/acetyltransferase-like protein (isoleucine patch superfamily)
MNPFHASGVEPDPDKALSQELTRNLLQGPRVHATAYVHARAVVIGNVTVGASASLWPCAVLRGDIAPIEIGDGTNIQDGAVVHVADGLPAVVGRRVTVGHLAMIHACRIEDECLIGMHATILDGARIGKGAVIAAGAVVDGEVPAYEIWGGVPARKIKARP